MKALSLLGAVLLASVGFAAAEDYDPVLSKSLLYYASATFCDEYNLQNWYCGTAC